MANCLFLDIIVAEIITIYPMIVQSKTDHKTNDLRNFLIAFSQTSNLALFSLLDSVSVQSTRVWYLRGAEPDRGSVWSERVQHRPKVRGGAARLRNWPLANDHYLDHKQGKWRCKSINSNWKGVSRDMCSMQCYSWSNTRSMLELLRRDTAMFSENMAVSQCFIALEISWLYTDWSNTHTAFWLKSPVQLP